MIMSATTLIQIRMKFFLDALDGYFSDVWRDLKEEMRKKIENFELNTRLKKRYGWDDTRTTHLVHHDYVANKFSMH